MNDNQLDKTKKFHFLSTVCNDQMPLNSKIAAFTLKDQKDSPSFEIALLLVEYLQVAAQTILLNPNINSTTTNEGLHSMFVSQLAQFFQPGFLFKPAENSPIIFYVLLVLMGFYTIFRYLLFGYIIISSVRKKQPGTSLIKSWRWIYKLQTRVIYSMVTSFWLSAVLNAISKRFIVLGGFNKTTAVFFSVLLIIEFLLSFSINRLYRFILPRKSLFSSKDSILETITLCQKFTLQVLQIILAAVSFYNFWIYAAINITFSLVRIGHFYTNLPNYNINGLFYKGFVITILTSLDVTCMIQQVREYQIDQGSWTYILVVWAILSGLAMKLSYEYLNKALLKLVSGITKGSPSLLIHKISVIRQLVKESKYHKPTSKNSYSALVRETLIACSNIVNSLQSGKKQELTEVNIKETLNTFYLKELEEELVKYPKNEVLKLYIAQIYMKKSSLRGSAIKYLIELQRSSNSIIAVNASLLMWKIQTILRTGSRKEKKEINLYIYFKTQADFAKLKKKMLKQNQFQHNVYQEILEDSPNLGKIQDYSQTVYRCKQDIESKAKVMLAAKPDYYVEPFQLLAIYHLTLNHSLIRYLDYNKNYIQNSQKYKKEFSSVNLTSGNIYQDETAFVIISGQKEDLGRIVYCTSSISDIYGGEPNIYTTANIMTLAPLHSQDFYNLFSFSTYEKASQEFFGRTFRGLCRHRDGHIIEIEYYVNVLPFLTKGFYYCMIIRPIPTSKDYMLVQENGNIEGVTKTLWQKLGLDKYPSTEVANIKLLSEDLSQANEAFNYVTLPEKYGEHMVEEAIDKFASKFKSKTLNIFAQVRTDSTKRLMSAATALTRKKPGISINKARELCDIFTTEGKEIQLSPILGDDSVEMTRLNRDSMLYDCKMTILSQTPELIKLVTFEDKIKMHSDPKAPEPEVTRQESAKNDLFKFLNRKFVPKVEGFSDFPPTDIEDEKAAGWIDFEAMLTRRSSNPVSQRIRLEERTTTFLLDPFNTTEGNLLSPMTSVRFKSKFATDILESPKRQATKRQTEFLFDSTETKGRENNKIVEKAETARLSSISKNSQEEKVSRAINLALTTKYYSRHIKILYVVFYILLIGVLVGEVAIKLILNTTVEDLRTKKNLITTSQMRDSALVTMQRSMRFIWDIGIGALSIPLLNKFKFTLNTYINSGSKALTDLINANQNITIGMGIFEDNIREFLFSNDVTVYFDDNDQASQNLTSVLATDKVIETGVKAIAASKKNLTAGSGFFSFLFRNSLNDLLLKTEANSEIFLNSIEKQVTQCETSVYIILFLLVGLLAVMLVMVTWVTITKYKEEKIYLSAITRLDNKEIKKSQDKLNIFKKVLEADRLSENKSHLKILNSMKMVSNDSNINARYVKNDKAPNHAQILGRSSLTILKTVFIHVVLIGLMILNSVTTINMVGYLKTEQGKLYLANGMAKEISLAYLEVQELFGSNGTALIRNESVEIQIQKAVTTMNSLRNSVMQVFQISEGEYDPLISKVLFGHDCAFLVNSSSTNFCGFIQNQNRRIGLISLLSDYEALVTDKIENFYASDRTMPVLRALQVEDADSLLATLRVMYDECNMIANRTNILFGEEFNQARIRGAQILAAISVVLVFLAWFTWMFVFWRLAETENRFKNVLQAFSPNLILSNFILKSFVITTSQGALDSVKSEFV